MRMPGGSGSASFFTTVGDLRALGLDHPHCGRPALPAAAGVLAGDQLARWLAVAVVELNAVNQMFIIPAYPFWSLTIIAIDVVALWALCVYGSRVNLAVQRGDGWPRHRMIASRIQSGEPNVMGPISGRLRARDRLRDIDRSWQFDVASFEERPRVS